MTASLRDIVEASRVRFEQYDGVLRSAREIFNTDAILMASSQQGSLRGMTLVLKDNICQQGQIAGCCSKILENYRAPYSATATVRLNEAGALLMGRANCDEFAMGSSNEYSAYYPTLNPWDLGRVPGGSSGGPIVAVAAGLVDCALGSETGGSVRLPASFCGIVGSKPTYGRISRYGLVAYGSSVDQIGIASRTVRDNARVMKVIAGFDERDATSSKVPVPDYEALLTGKLPKGLRIGVVDNAFDVEGNDPEMIALLQNAIEQYRAMGAQIVHLSLPTMDYGAAVYFVVSRAEAASNLARYDGIRYGTRAKDAKDLADVYIKTRSEQFGREPRRRIMIGNYVLSAGYADQYYKKAKAVQAGMRAEFLKAFDMVDVLFFPVSPIPAFKFGSCNPLQMDLMDYFTCPINLVGVPALAIPCGFTKEKLPVGFQLCGPMFSEDRLFQVGYAYEQQNPWHTMMPEAFKK